MTMMVLATAADVNVPGTELGARAMPVAVTAPGT